MPPISRVDTLIADEFDAYDLSEFSQEDFALLDSLTSREHTPVTSPDPQRLSASSGAQKSRASIGGGRCDSSASTAGAALGGPRIPVEIEPAANPASIKVSSSAHTGSSTRETESQKGQSKNRVKGRKAAASPSVDPQSPLARHRPSQRLSVSDLVGPVWCEVQYDYGLRQGRSRKLANRPASFTSAQGKTIVVEQQTAVKNEKILERGRSIHKQLEKEIRPEEVIIEAQTDEERWALRLVNILSCLDNLVDSGYSREIPVFGIVHGQLVTGIIDEIIRKASPVSEVSSPASGKRSSPSKSESPKKSKKQRTPSPSQSAITTFFSSPTKPTLSSPIAEDSELPTISRGYTLFILDSKTRRAKSLPSTEDALNSRLQLMTYHRLLSELLSPSFDFTSLWERLHLDPARLLSDAFLESSGLLPTGVRCLDGLCVLWRNSVDALHIDRVAPTLEIVYRYRPYTKRKALDSVKEAEESNQAPLMTAKEAEDVVRAVEACLRQEDVDLARAIAESLKGLTNLDRTSKHIKSTNVGRLGEAGELVSSSTEPRASTSSSTLRKDPDLAWVTQEETLNRGDSDAVAAVARNSPDSKSTNGFETSTATPTTREETHLNEDAKSEVIGRTLFTMDDKLLDAHLKSVLAWWYGQRAPRGVEIEQSRRCFSCEYIQDCEWREQKALEATARYTDSRGHSEQPSGPAA